MPKWRVYYDDGTYSDDEVTQPYRVICIVQPREKTGREVLSMYPYYVQKNDRWYPAEDLPSLVQQMIYHADKIDAVVMGIWVSDETYNSIVAQAKTDEGFLPRSAYDPDMRR